jgi:hypothetical protein
MVFPLSIHFMWTYKQFVLSLSELINFLYIGLYSGPDQTLEIDIIKTVQAFAGNMLLCVSDRACGKLESTHVTKCG